MEEKQELNNILLDQQDSNQSNAKKYLLIGSGLVLLFIVILVIMRAVNSDDSNNNVLPPEPSVISQKDKTLFQKVEIKEQTNSDDEFEQIVKDIKAKASASSEELANENVVDIPKNNIALQNKKISKPKPPVQKVIKQIEVKKPVVTQPKKSTTSKSGIYIQVGAFARLKPDMSLIKKIKTKGYKYIVYDTKINGKKLKKLLIGPYSNDKAARRDISTIKSSINKGAFLLRVK